MPIFKSTYNIIKKPDEDEVFESSWMATGQICLPPKVEWDYKRELLVEDVDIWEVIYEESGARGVYAAWCPYAEFYMITNGVDEKNDPRIINGLAYQDRLIETFYGKGAAQKTYQRAYSLGIKLPVHKIWVDNHDMWLYNTDC